MKKSRKNLPKIEDDASEEILEKENANRRTQDKRLKIQKNCLQRLEKRLKYRAKNAKN